MIEGKDAITQAFLGTLFTWAFTALGAGAVVIFDGTKVGMVYART